MSEIGKGGAPLAPIPEGHIAIVDVLTGRQIIVPEERDPCRRAVQVAAAAAGRGPRPASPTGSAAAAAAGQEGTETTGGVVDPSVSQR